MDPERPTRRFTLRHVLLALALAGVAYLLFDFFLPANRGDERTLRGHTRSVHCLAFAPDGARLFSGGHDGQVIAWDLKTFESEVVLDLAPHRVDALAVSPNCSLLAIACDFDTTVGDKWEARDPTSDGIRALVVDLRTGKRVAELRSPLEKVTGLAFAPRRAELYVADCSGRLTAWNIQNWTLKRQGPNKDAWSQSFAMSPNGSLLAITTDEHIQLFDPDLRPTGPELVRGGGKGWGLAFAPDGKRIAFAFRGGVKVADTSDGSTVHIFPPPRFAGPVAYSPDGRLVAIGSMTRKCLFGYSGRVSVWRVGRGEEVLSRRQSDIVTKVAFSPDGGYLAVADGSGSIKLLSTEGW